VLNVSSLRGNIMILSIRTRDTHEYRTSDRQGFSERDIDIMGVSVGAQSAYDC
jgi:hypothetical protein